MLHVLVQLNREAPLAFKGTSKVTKEALLVRLLMHAYGVPFRIWHIHTERRCDSSIREFFDLLAKCTYLPETMNMFSWAACDPCLPATIDRFSQASHVLESQIVCCRVTFQHQTLLEVDLSRTCKRLCNLFHLNLICCSISGHTVFILFFLSKKFHVLAVSGLRMIYVTKIWVLSPPPPKKKLMVYLRYMVLLGFFLAIVRWHISIHDEPKSEKKVESKQRNGGLLFSLFFLRGGGHQCCFFVHYCKCDKLVVRWKQHFDQFILL